MLAIQQRLTKSFFVVLSLPATAMGFALSVQISALSWILSTKYHLDYEQVGYVWLSGPLAGIAGQLIVGLVSDKVWFWQGRRRPFILVGGALAALMLLALPNIDQVGQGLGLANLLVVATIVALTLDLAINVSFNPTRAIIADTTPDGPLRTRGYTWMQTISGMFGVMAYAISAIFDNYVLIYVGVGLVLLFSLGPPFLIAEPRELAPADSPGQPAPSRSVDWGELMKLYVAHAFTWVGVQTMFVYIFAYIKHELPPLADQEIGQVIALSFLVLNTVGFVLPAPILQPLARQIGQVRTHTLCIGIMAVGYGLIVLLGHSAWWLYALMGVVGVGWAATVSLPFAIMTEKVDKTRTGFFMGIFNLSVVVPQLVVSGVLGRVVNQADDKSLVFMISAATLAVSAGLWTLVKENPRGQAPAVANQGGH
jgi:maltose/moltooligosaccharide transporter